MTFAKPSLAAAAALTLLAGCGQSSGGTRAAGPVPAATPTQAQAEQVCLRAVARSTVSPQVVLSSRVVPAGTEVIVGVGPQRARWRCIAEPDGRATGIMSLTDEGRY